MSEEDGWYNWGEIHTLPSRDLYEHDKTELCACRPRIVIEGNMVKQIIHNSFDNREASEPDRLQIVKDAVDERS